MPARSPGTVVAGPERSGGPQPSFQRAKIRPIEGEEAVALKRAQRRKMTPRQRLWLRWGEAMLVAEGAATMADSSPFPTRGREEHVLSRYQIALDIGIKNPKLGREATRRPAKAMIGLLGEWAAAEVEEERWDAAKKYYDRAAKIAPYVGAKTVNKVAEAQTLLQAKRAEAGRKKAEADTLHLL